MPSYQAIGYNESNMSNFRPKYVDFTLIRITAFIHFILGSVVLVLSGVVLFALPAFVFYLTFLFGFYLFLPGVAITFGIINKSTARKWARYMIPIGKWLKLR